MGVRIGRVFQGLVLGFADGLLLWIPLATLFPAQMVGAYAAMATGGAVAGDWSVRWARVG